MKNRFRRFVFVLCILFFVLASLGLIILGRTLWLKVSFTGEENKFATRIPSPIGFIHHDADSRKVQAYLFVSVKNYDRIPHRITFILEPDKYQKYHFISSPFELTSIREVNNEEVSKNIKDFPQAGVFLGEKEVTLQPGEEKDLHLIGEADFGGTQDHRRAGPPIVLKVLD